MTPLSKRRKVDSSKDCKDEEHILLPHHKIFLSHSGVQKEEFVEQLCVDLERRHRFPFFDKRPSSLPKGERFPALIKAAVAQCEMMVVVVSEEYFTSKWPMIELHGFMQASMNNQNLKILPLFFGLNVDEFSNTCRQKGWFKKWEEMAKADVRIEVDEWKRSLELIVPFNGLVYDRDSKEVVTYRKEVVSNICKAIPADIKFDESHVQGRSKLCQVVRQHGENIPDSTKIRGVRVMGLYGVGGIGKTQICKIMCNELDGEFDGKVCHVELGNQSEHELVKKVLTTLTTTSVEVVEEVEKDRCRDILLNAKIWKQKTFLTIDNVWDDFSSLEQAKSYLRAPFVEGSWVIVTSRFKKTLISLNVDENACFEMPELEEDDARDMFLYYAADGKHFKNTEDVDAIEECIKSCYFGKGGGRGSHYHPLSLKALGVFLQYGGKGPSIWVTDLQKLKESSYSREPMNPLFTILRSNFDRLPKMEQELFMDVALFFPPNKYEFMVDLMEWLCLVHNKKKEEIENWLQHLVDSALLEDADMRSRKVSMHDLYRDFAKLESQGKLVPLDMENRRWVYAEDALPTELEDKQRSLTRVCISEFVQEVEKPMITSLSTIEWKSCKKLVVLKLDNLSKLSGVLNLKGLIRLRSLSVNIKDISTFDSIEGLKDLTTLTYFKMVCGRSYHHEDIEDHVSKVGQLPAALKVLEVEANVLFERNVIALCTNLVSLKLRNVCASDLDLENCTSLQEVELIKIKELKILQGFALELGSSLQSLEIWYCSELFEVCGLDRLVGLLSLDLVENRILSKLSSLTGLTRLHRLNCRFLDNLVEVPGLDGLVGLKSLSLIGSMGLSKLPSLTGLQCLRELEIRGLGITEIPNLSGLEELEVIDASQNFKLTSLQGFGNLPAVKCIYLCHCLLLCRLSDMSKLTNLKELDLSFTRVELHEEDMRMLGRLPLLEPVLVSSLSLNATGGIPHYRLDFKGHKILSCLRTRRQLKPLKGNWQTWRESGWEENDLHYPPAAGSVYEIRDVDDIWKLIPGPATKRLGTGGWVEKDLHDLSAAGYHLERSYEIRNAEDMWNVIPKPELLTPEVMCIALWTRWMFQDNLMNALFGESSHGIEIEELCVENGGEEREEVVEAHGPLDSLIIPTEDLRLTYMLEGAFCHQDFKGHKGTIHAGDVQWMTAGRGIVHCEMPATRGLQRGLQLWVNLSSKDKMIEPNYQEVQEKDIPRVDEGGVKVIIIAGESFGVASLYTHTYHVLGFHS